MEKLKSMPLKSLILLMALVTVVLTGCKAADRIHEVPAEDSYTYENPDAVRAEPDAGFEINGVLDETAYKNNNWLYLHNEDGGNNVDIAMTSYYGEKGMYFVYDVTESAPIYVNTKRPSYMNSCIEMYLAPSYVSGVQENSIFEIDMMPTGDLTFKKSNGKYGYENVISTNDKMACLGTTTKGGEVNTPECKGYTLELFIPWEYMRWLEMDVDAMKNSFVYVNPAHITSNNLNGTDTNLDRYWYFYAQQNGAEFTDVSQYFRFNADGILGTVPVTLEQGEHYTITGAPAVIPGMQAVVNIQPEAGYALTSIMVNGEEQIRKVSFNEDGSVTLKIRSPKDGVKVAAKAETVSQGNKTLSGQIVLNRTNGDTLKGLVLSYFGPKGERPLEIDASGKFCLQDLEQGYYVLKAEKEGYTSLNRSIYLNQDIYTELVLEYNYFQVTKGSCWILDGQNVGVLHKLGGAGQILSNESYTNFDFSLNLKYDDELATQDKGDLFVQQRAGMQIRYSNGKTWHIDLMKENDKFILQYARMSGDNSVTNWRTARVLDENEIRQYKSENGIRLRVMRQGRYAAVWLGQTLVVIEMFDESYDRHTAQLGVEAWICNRTVMDIPFSIRRTLPVDVAGSAFHWPAEIWDISNQYNGTVTKFPAPGKDTWLDTKINVNDVTTIAKDLSPESNDYSFTYIFKFSNGENFRVRLNHTDDDGKYRIQSFAGSTVFAPWKNHYTLTDAQAEKVGTDGIAYRVWIAGTTAYVFLDGKAVCSYDLSTNIHTGKPSGIENATSTVSFRLDGNLKGNTVIPFELVQNTQKPPEVSLIPGEVPHNDFTATAYLRYDTALAQQGTTDAHVQQRSGMRISFSNGKNWHVHLMKENDQYILQYAKMSGDNSVFNWRTVRVLTEAEAAQYESAEGIRLQLMRQGRYGAVWLGDTLLVIELLGEEYQTATAKLTTEAWISGLNATDMVLDVADSVPVDVAGSAFHWPAEIWDISDQYNGTFSKLPAPGKDTWLDGKLNVNDVTTTCVDLDPESKTYSMIYIFKFSNGESFRLRLNHTDNDDKFRIQSFANSTLSPAWKNYYTLTDEQAQKALTTGVDYRVRILGTTAYVYIDATEVCTIDLSTNIHTGKPSGIENATSTISFRMDGNNTGITKIPFHFENNAQNVSIRIAETENGVIRAEKDSYKLGDTVKLTVTGEAGYAYTELSVNGQPVTLDWDGTYSFVADKNIYTVSGSFAEGFFKENKDSAWNLINQNKGMLQMTAHATGNSGTLQANDIVNNVTTLVKDLTPDAKDFSMIYEFRFSNGEKFVVRLHHTDDDGKYRIQSVSGSTVFEPWKNAYTLTDAQAAKVQGDGISFNVVIRTDVAYVSLDDQEVCTYDLSKVVATGKPSEIANADATALIRMDGNLNRDVTVPFALADSKLQVLVKLPQLENGKITCNQVSYKIGDTVSLTVLPNTGYSQKLCINGEPMLLDWKSNTYSFVATENIYEITGSFEPSLKMTASDANRWDTANQAQGVLNAYYPVNNDSWWMDFKGEYDSITVKAKNYLPVADTMDGNGKVGFAVILRVTMDNGKVYAFRVINDKGTYAYDRYGAGGSLTGWGNWKNLNHLADAFNGEGVAFKLERTDGNKLTMSVNGVVTETYTMSGVTIANRVASVSVQHNGNPGPKIAVPYQVTGPAVPDGSAQVQLNIDTMANGTVVPAASTYRVGQTVTLIVTPNAGYSQKLYANGEPLLLDWKTNTCSFVATEELYHITGGFEPSVQATASDANRWDTSNQAQGVLRTYYPANNDSWWMDFNGDYKSLSVKAKNYWPIDASYEGIANGGGFRVALRANMDNGKSYAFSIWIDTSKRYTYNHFGASGSVTGWGGAWSEIKAKDPVAYDLLNGAGADFKLERIDGNHFQISINGTVLETYTISDVTAANKVVSVGVCYWGNKGEYVDVPFELVEAANATRGARPLEIAALPAGKEDDEANQ